LGEAGKGGDYRRKKKIVGWKNFPKWEKGGGRGRGERGGNIMTITEKKITPKKDEKKRRGRGKKTFSL